MIIISNRPGQLGNLLFIYAHFLAYSIENNITLLNPAFYEYQHYFKKGHTSFFLKSKLFYKSCYLFARVLVKLHIKTPFLSVVALDWAETVTLENSKELKSNLCFVQGWLFRSDKLVLKHTQKIKNFFEPTEFLKNKIDSFFKQNFSAGNETIIGIHIRRGDYNTFEGGKYYYSVEQYAQMIKNIANLFYKSSPHFLICSNETINLNDNDMGDLKITLAPSHQLLDMYCLAKCNYIAGPPSTYSMWASFYGNTPLCTIKTIDKELTINDFKTQLFS